MHGIGQLNGFTVATEARVAFPLGGVDQNGVFDFLDIGPFVNLLSTGAFQLEADVDGRWR